MRGVTIAACVAALAAASAPAAEANGPPKPIAGTLPDPLATGPCTVKRSYYSAGTLQTTVPSSSPYGQSTRGAGVTIPQPLEGNVTWPGGGALCPSAPHRAILFLHGRHSACKTVTGTDGGSQNPATGACPVNPPVGGPSGPEANGDKGSETGFWPSWQGYNYLSDLLASQGYVVISPSAGALVAFDQGMDAGALARAEIIANTLDLLAAWNLGSAPPPTATQTAAGQPGIGTQLVGQVDASSVGVMGHSRGGEGAAQFIEFNRERPAPGARYNLTGVFSLAPIDVQDQYPRGTNFATLLPACDGDVSTLQGANAFERGKYTAPDDPFARYQYYVEGANHNYYNTRWPASDRGGSDPACGTGGAARLSASDQRKTGLAAIDTFLRVYSGGEAVLAPWLNDSVGYPPSACPSGPLGLCEDVVKTSYIAPATERQSIIHPDSGVRPTTASPQAPDSAGGKLSGSGFDKFEWCNPDTAVAFGAPCGSGFNRSFGPQLAIAWGGPATLAATVRGAARDATRYGTLNFRASVDFTDPHESASPAAETDPRAASKDFTIALVGRDGRSSAVRLSSVYPGGLERSLGALSSPAHEVLNGFRIPLARFNPSAVNLSDLDRVELRFGGGSGTATGAIQVADLAFQEQPGAVGTDAVPLEPLPGDRELPPVDGVPTGDPRRATPHGACVDRARPTVRIERARGTGRPLVSGVAADRGCRARGGLRGRAGGVQRVQVSVARELGSGRCRFVIGDGRLTKRKPCTIPVALVARGGRSWRVTASRRTPPGRYRVRAAAIDRVGNVSAAASRRLRVR